MINYQRVKLSNGLTVLLHQDMSTPLVAVNLLFRAGSKYDPPAKSGLAHLFEHLMFSGTKAVPNFDAPVQMAGGENNAFTNNDYADYYCYGPSRNLETFLWLEADRLKNLRLRQEEFAVQQKVVIEELLESCFNVPYGDVWHHLLPTVYQDFPYAWPTIGLSEEEIACIRLDDVKAFHQRYYHISNAILSIAGNVDIVEATDLLERHFGTLNGTHVKIPSFSYDIGAYVPGRITIEADVPVESFYLVFPMPGRGDRSYYALDLISDLLAVGRSSILYQTFIKENELLSNVDAYITGNIEGGLFIVEGRLSDGSKLEEVERCFWNLINRLLNDGIAKVVMQKLKNSSESNLVFSEIGTLNKSMNLSYFELIGDVDLINREAAIYQGISAGYLMEITQTYIDPKKATLLHYLPRK